MPRRIELDELRRRSLHARARRARDLTLAVAVGRRSRRSSLRDHDAPGCRSTRAVLSRTCAAGGRRSQRRERHPRRLSWLRHAGRDHGPGHGRAHRLRAAAPVPTRLGKSRHSRAQREDAAREALDVRRRLARRATLRIPAAIGRVLLPVAGIVSVYFLLRGHNAPGGGFVGGLVMATGIIVQYMTSGVLWVESRLRVHPQYWVGRWSARRRHRGHVCMVLRSSHFSRASSGTLRSAARRRCISRACCCSMSASTWSSSARRCSC